MLKLGEPYLFQVRECVALFLRLAKGSSIPIILIGHVTKSGDVAGPKTVEHMVDCVLYLESHFSATQNVRMLRASKNRFGSSDEVGIFQMSSPSHPQGAGKLLPVADPSSLFLSHRNPSRKAHGCAVSLTLEGSRPIAAEIQALVASTHQTPRRTVDGISIPRLLLVLAVLQQKCHLPFRNKDVYLNVVGGIRLAQSSRGGSASDLAVALSLVGSLLQVAVRADTAFVGEIGLLGEIRRVPDMEKRMGEAKRMGFARMVVPSRYAKSFKKIREEHVDGITLVECHYLSDAINAGLEHSVLPFSKRQFSSKRNQNDIARDHGIDDDIIDDDGIDDDAEDDIHDEFHPDNIFL